MQGIKSIIFDLGGVLLNLDFNKVSEAFKKLGVTNFDDMYSRHKANSLFKHLEEGKISEEEFYNTFRTSTRLELSDEDIRDAWNSMLLDFRKPGLEFLTSIKHKYDLYLLSNTNAIHFSALHKIYSHNYGSQNFNDYFTKAYYSHLIGFRKPDKEIYNYVLQHNNLINKETLFIDDSIENIEGAKYLDLNTIHLKEGMKIEKLGL